MKVFLDGNDNTPVCVCVIPNIENDIFNLPSERMVQLPVIVSDPMILSEGCFIVIVPSSKNSVMIPSEFRHLPRIAVLGFGEQAANRVHMIIRILIVIGFMVDLLGFRLT